MGTQNNPSYYRVEVIAQLFNVSVRRVQQLTQDGVVQTVSVTEDGKKVKRYDLGPTVQAYVKFLQDMAYGREQKKSDADLKNKKLEAEIKLKESQAELHQLKTAIQSGKYIAVEKIQEQYAVFFAQFKKFALAMPNRLMGHMAGRLEPMEMRKIEKDMSSEVTDMLQSFVVAAEVAEPETVGDGM